MNCIWIGHEGVVVTELADDATAASVGFQKGDIILVVNNQKIAKTSDLEKRRAKRRGSGASPWCAASRSTLRSRMSRSDHAKVQACSPRRDEQDAPHPLPDRLRPARCSMWWAGSYPRPDGALTRMLATRTLGSLIFWGPPGTGKTTVARLLRMPRNCISNNSRRCFPGRRFEEGVRRRPRAARDGKGTCCSSMRCIGSTAPSRIRFCL